MPMLPIAAKSSPASRLAARAGLLLIAGALLCACQGKQGPPGPQGPVGPEGPQGPKGNDSTQGDWVRVEALSVGNANCPGGGVAITSAAGPAYVCNGANGANGANGSDAQLPPGAVVAFAGNTPPNGWLLCDGRMISRTQYGTLFSAIGIAHGGGDGINTFNLPDYRGRFLRGVDRSTGRDPDRAARVAMATGGATGDAVGSVEAAAFTAHLHGVTDPGHAHAITDPGHNHAEATTNGTAGSRETAGTLAGGWDYADCCGSPVVSTSKTGISINTATTGISLQSTGGNETRPVNAGVNWIIKI